MSDSSYVIKELYRYPIKGMSPDRLNRVIMSKGSLFPGDRHWAVENGSRDFDPGKPTFFPKVKFLQLMSNDTLAGIETRFDGQTATLTILRDGEQVAHGCLEQRAGRERIEQFLAAYLGKTARGLPHLVSAEEHHFCDIPARFVSCINLASVRDLERVSGHHIDPLRFRANIYIDAGEPWCELNWLDQTLITRSGAAFQVMDRIERCAATNVAPQTGRRDMQIPRLLADAFGHQDCGVYMKVTNGGELRPGDSLSLETD